MSTDDVERLLRATLADRADSAPDPERLAGRVLAAVDIEARASRGVVAVPLHTPTSIDRADTRSRQRRSARLLVPLAAAASVAAVVGLGVALADSNSPRSASSVGVAALTAAAVSESQDSAGAGVGATEALGSARVSSPPASGGKSSAPSVNSTDASLPTGFRLSDLTYDSATTAFGLGTVPCTTGRCTVLARSSGARSWRAVNATLPFAVAGAQDAPGSTGDLVSHIRFASPKVGYAFGDQVLFVTDDGGLSWTRTAARTTAVEVADTTALTVQTVSCIGTSCQYRIVTSAPGSAKFTPAAVPGVITGSAVVLARAGQNAFVAVDTGVGHPLLSSSDGGATWSQTSPDVCPSSAVAGPAGSTSTAPSTGPAGSSSSADEPSAATPAIVITSLAAASDGSVTALCSSSAGQFVAVSTDRGGTLTTAAVPASANATALSAPSARVLVVAGSTLTRSVDGGQTWSTVAGLPALGSTRWLGFDDATHGAWVGGPATSVWSTTDAGATYREYAFA